MADSDNTTLMKMAIISISASLIINMIIFGYGLSNDGNIADSEYPYNSVLFQLVEQYQPQEFSCEQGTDCTAQISNVPTQDTNIFNVIQSLVNIGLLIAGLFEIVSMTVLLPLYLNIALQGYITNGWILALGKLFTSIWAYINIWLILKLVFK